MSIVQADSLSGGDERSSSFYVDSSIYVVLSSQLKMFLLLEIPCVSHVRKFDLYKAVM